MMVRTVKNPDERRGELIACARQLFYTQGYESTSVRDIVEALGVAKGTFYYYFDSKQAILEATVDAYAEQALAVMRQIVDDDALSAVPKWIKALQVTASWKTARKEQLLALLRMLQHDENALLQYKLRSKSLQALAPEMAHIIEQGIAEGVFDTANPQDAAEIVISVLQSSMDSFVDIVLHPDRYAEPASLAARKLASLQSALERVLGAAPGSLPLFDEDTFAAWFESGRVRQLERI